MSGSAALSAAKNRRSGGATNSVSKPSSTQSKSQQIQNNSLPAEIKQSLHPLKVLQNHDLMLKKHDEELATLISINNENKSLGGESSNENTEVTEKLNNLEKIFKSLHNDFNEIKKEINKVMSFSMGVNTELMTLKKEITGKLELLNNQEDKVEDIENNQEDKVEDIENNQEDKVEDIENN